MINIKTHKFLSSPLVPAEIFRVCYKQNDRVCGRAILCLGAEIWGVWDDVRKNPMVVVVAYGVRSARSGLPVHRRSINKILYYIHSLKIL